MKKSLILIGISLVVLFSFSSAHALTYSFSPEPPDLNDLPHSYFYSWCVDWQPSADEIVVGATLAVENIDDWTIEDNDFLYFSYLPGMTDFVSVRQYTDWQDAGDDWAGWGITFITYSDLDLTGKPSPEDIIYDFFNPDPVLDPDGFGPTIIAGIFNDALANGQFGIGIDPDCHYYNDGITITITTAPVPEPATLLLLGFGIVGLGLIKRRKSY